MIDECAIHQAVELIAKRWTLLIILEIHKGNNGKKRFSELKKSLKSITPKMLSERLRELEQDGLIKHSIDASEIPIKSIYSLTEKSKDLINVLNSIKKWSVRWNPPHKSCEINTCKHCKN
jgi:DNA-binding HxlR family transcriptional regulator